MTDTDEYRKLMKELGPPPDRIKEIISRWPFLWPLERSKGELADAIVAANRDIDYLLEKILSLEAELVRWRSIDICDFGRERGLQ